MRRGCHVNHKNTRVDLKYDNSPCNDWEVKLFNAIISRATDDILSDYRVPWVRDARRFLTDFDDAMGIMYYAQYVNFDIESLLTNVIAKLDKMPHVVRTGPLDRFGKFDTWNEDVIRRKM